MLGRSVEGRDVEVLRIGVPAEGKRTVWIIARQHPGRGEEEGEEEREGKDLLKCERSLLVVVPVVSQQLDTLLKSRTCS